MLNYEPDKSHTGYYQFCPFQSISPGKKAKMCPVVIQHRHELLDALDGLLLSVVKTVMKCNNQHKLPLIQPSLHDRDWDESTFSSKYRL